jgi:signal transduction histidine kinase
MYGMLPGQFVGFYQQWVESLHPDDRESAPSSLARSIAERTPWEHEFRILHPDGQVRWMAGRGQCFYDDDGRPVRMIGVNIDITGRKSAEEALRKSEKLSAAGRLAATIAHEINNPLEAVTNLLYLAKGGADPETARLLEAADQELRRVAHIARQTLGFYRESSAHTVFDAAATVRQVIDFLSRHLENRHMRAQVEAHPAPLKASEGEIRQVISNLVVNAIDASSPGSSLRVRVGPAALRCNGQLRPATRITVADYGHGIPREILQHLGEPFFTTKKDVGTGLGLWVSRGIVEKHSGHLQVRSRPGRGTVFSVLLPRLSQGDAVK